jgi:hypothetical protein
MPILLWGNKNLSVCVLNYEFSKFIHVDNIFLSVLMWQESVLVRWSSLPRKTTKLYFALRSVYFTQFVMSLFI